MNINAAFSQHSPLNCTPLQIILPLNHTVFIFKDLIIEFLPPPISLDQPVTYDKLLPPPIGDLNSLQGKQYKACLVSFQTNKSLWEHSPFHSFKTEIGKRHPLCPWKIDCLGLHLTAIPTSLNIAGLYKLVLCHNWTLYWINIWSSHAVYMLRLYVFLVIWLKRTR